MSMVNEPEAYLKSGSNELKILEYSVGKLRMGINILKVSRILDLPSHTTNSRTAAHAAVIGMFEDHSHVVPLVDLSAVLGIERSQSGGRVIITEFFDEITGFLVDTVEQVHTLLWENVKGAEEIMGGRENPYVLAIAQPNGGKNVLMIDYEKIVLELSPELGNREINRSCGLKWDGHGRTVLVAEDSKPVRDMLEFELGALGLKVMLTRDGEKAVESFDATPDIALVILDVEMPKKDGLAILGHIRQHSDRGKTPVLVYSSIGDIGMKERARVMDANGHITKLDMNTLLDNVKKLISNSSEKKVNDGK